MKAFLLDQRRIAGVGNIYADEALFRAGIHPLRPAGRLSREQYGRLRETTIAALQAVGLTAVPSPEPVTNPAQNGLVVLETPAAGSHVKRNSAVSLEIGNYTGSTAPTGPSGGSGASGATGAG